MSFYTSLSGLKGAQTDLSVTSNNIANVGAAGFKKSRAEFGDLVSASPLQTNIPGQGTRLKAIAQEFTQGGFRATDRTLDIAIGGQGFFVVRSGAGADNVAFTRNGAFYTDLDRNVVDSRNAKLQVMPVDPITGVPTSTDIDDLENLVLPVTNTAGSKLDSIAISTNGLVTATYGDGSVDKLGKVAIANFPNPVGLRQLGDASWGVTGISGPPEVGEASTNGLGVVQSGALEQANVDITEELVALIAAQRNFQANAKAIETANTMTSTIINLQ